MAKVTLSVRINPQTLEKIDQTAALLGTTRGKVAGDALEEMYGGELTPIEFAQMALDANAKKLLGDYFDGLKKEAMDVTEEAKAKIDD